MGSFRAVRSCGTIVMLWVLGRFYAVVPGLPEQETSTPQPYVAHGLDPGEPELRFLAELPDLMSPQLKRPELSMAVEVKAGVAKVRFAVREQVLRTPETPTDTLPLNPGDQITDGLLPVRPDTTAIPVQFRPQQSQTGALGDQRPSHLNLWQVSAWSYFRESGLPQSLASTGRLGGSQAGVRVDAPALVAMDEVTIGAYGRATSAIHPTVEQEIALGIVAKRQFRGARLALAFERRQSVARGGRNAFSAYAAGGFQSEDPGDGVTISGYAQAGIVGLEKRDAFVDGGLTVEKRVATVSGSNVSIGAGSWGAVQPEVARLDVGPAIIARIPVGSGQIRVSVDYRIRIEGNARPASGLALAIGMDY